MIKGAHKKLGNQDVKYIIGDYAKLKFNTQYDIAVSVIGIHHQSTAGKKKLFKKIHSLLKPKGIFIYGDLVTFKNKYKSAYNNALHYHHLVEHATDSKTLEEWAHHHQYLNDLAPLEEQIAWLKSAGFKKITTLLLEMNTALLIAQK
jgi:tRNA (cmo5U34)-methyltransferase